jgi:AcrR family transcriptional regulator
MVRVSTEVRREQLIDAAVEVIAQAGVDGATTRRIAEVAGAPLATLYYCFQSKENLLWAVFERLAEGLREEVDRATNDGRDMAGVASYLLKQAFDWSSACPEANKAQFEIWLWAVRNDTALAKRLYALFMASWERALRTAPNPLPESQLDSLAHVALGLVDGLCMQLVSRADLELARRELRVATEMLEVFLDR